MRTLAPRTIIAAAALLAGSLAGVGGAAAADQQRLALLEVAPGLGGMLGPVGAIAPVALDSPKVSGLAWRSGLACGDAARADWRGRALDTSWFGVTNASWAQMVRQTRSAKLRSRAAAAPQIVVSLPLLAQPNAFQFAECAAGAFDQHFRHVGASLQSRGAGHAVVRLGKEANRGTAPFGWRSVDDLPAYRACFRNAVLALKSRAPGLKIEWTNARQTLSPVNPLDAYPGGDVVDIVGVHYYDNPAPGRQMTQAIWDAQYAETHAGGGPRGLGKKLAVSEWGVWGSRGGPPDNPVYVDNMYRFFRANAADIEYESYYDCALTHQLFPSTRFPNAAAAYQRLWSAGQ
jgi:hypothetical protein